MADTFKRLRERGRYQKPSSQTRARMVEHDRTLVSDEAWERRVEIDQLREVLRPHDAMFHRLAEEE